MNLPAFYEKVLNQKVMPEEFVKHLKKMRQGKFPVASLLLSPDRKNLAHLWSLHITIIKLKHI
jgi:hypothetical protein